MKLKFKFAGLLVVKMLLVLTSVSMTGCVRLVIIPANKEILRLKVGDKAPVDGYLVPDARMIEILDALDKKALE